MESMENKIKELEQWILSLEVKVSHLTTELESVKNETNKNNLLKRTQPLING